MSPLDTLIHELSKLPGIGGRTAMRLALHILRQHESYAKNLAKALVEVVEQTRFCSQCLHITHVDPCAICMDTKRDQRLICVVEQSSDLMALEKTRQYRGLYHVLHGSLSPLDGIGPDQLRIRELIARLSIGVYEEIIMATNPNVTGDATALYISKLLKPMGIKVTRLASGVPLGSDLEYVDQATLSKALESRIAYN